MILCGGLGRFQDFAFVFSRSYTQHVSSEDIVFEVLVFPSQHLDFQESDVETSTFTTTVIYFLTPNFSATTQYRDH